MRNGYFIALGQKDDDVQPFLLPLSISENDIENWSFEKWSESEDLPPCVLDNVFSLYWYAHQQQLESDEIIISIEIQTQLQTTFPLLYDTLYDIPKEIMNIAQKVMKKIPISMSSIMGCWQIQALKSISFVKIMWTCLMTTLTKDSQEELPITLDSVLELLFEQMEEYFRRCEEHEAAFKVN